MDNFDLIIIGSGSGNSIPAEFADRRIALIEKGTFGGTCLNIGCIPSKMFVLPADVAEAAHNGHRLGLDTSFNGADWGAIRDRVFGRIDPITAGGEEYRASGTPNLEPDQGNGPLRPPAGHRGRRSPAPVPEHPGRHRVTPHHPRHRGSRPGSVPHLRHRHAARAVPRPSRHDRWWLHRNRMGHVFSGFGSEVTMFNRSDVLLRAVDPRWPPASPNSSDGGSMLHLGGMPDRVEAAGDAIRLMPGCIETSRGRRGARRHRSATELGPDRHRGRRTRRGRRRRVEVDETRRRTIEGVWAIGDVANNYQLKHLANAEAKVAFWNLANPDHPRQADYRAVPDAVFSDPQVAAVGLTERQATTPASISGRTKGLRRDRIRLGPRRRQIRSPR